MSSAIASSDFVPDINPIKRLGQHPIGFWFVFTGEFAERASYYGMRTILALYLTEIMGYSEGGGATVMKAFMAACYLTPFLGGYIAERYLGRYKTILYYSAPYILGHIILGGFQNKYALFIALGLLALGSGAIKPNTSVLMGQIYDANKKNVLLTEAFSLFYAAVNAGAFLSAFCLPMVRNRWGYGAALMIPAVLMAVAFVFFASGKKFYPAENVRAIPPKTPEQKALERKTLLRIAGIFGLIAVFWLVYDQNADTWIYFGNKHGIGTYDPVHKVAHLTTYPPFTLPLKAVLVGGLLAFGALIGWLGRGMKNVPVVIGAVFLSLAAAAFFFAPSAMEMDGTATADQVQSLNALFIVILTPVFNSIWSIWRKMRGGIDIPDTRKMLVGFGIVIACMAVMTVAGFLARSGPVSVWWIILATFVITLAELCISVVGLEFAFKVAAPGTKSIVTAAFHSTVFVGDSVALTMAPFYENGLAPFAYFGLQGIIMTIAAVAFVPVARKFERGDAAAQVPATTPA